MVGNRTAPVFAATRDVWQWQCERLSSTASGVSGTLVQLMYPHYFGAPNCLLQCKYSPVSAFTVPSRADFPLVSCIGVTDFCSDASAGELLLQPYPVPPVVFVRTMVESVYMLDQTSKC